MSHHAFEDFRQHVLQNPDLQQRLRQETDETAFFKELVRAGEKAGFSFSEAEAREALRAQRRAWSERWI